MKNMRMGRARNKSENPVKLKKYGENVGSVASFYKNVVEELEQLTNWASSASNNLSKLEDKLKSEHYAPESDTEACRNQVRGISTILSVIEGLNDRIKDELESLENDLQEIDLL